MAIGVNSIVRFKCFHTFQSQQCLNVSFYEVQAVTPGSVVAITSYLAYGYASLWQTTLAPRLSNGFVFDRVEVDEVNGVSIGSHAYPPGTAGVVSGEGMPVQDAVSVQLTRNDRTTRHGGKRFSGLSEASQLAGSLTGVEQTNWTTAMKALYYPDAGPNIDVGLLDGEGEQIGTVTLRAIIWGGNSPSFPMGRFQYVAGVDVNPFISTQNTRKRGRGV